MMLPCSNSSKYRDKLLVFLFGFREHDSFIESTENFCVKILTVLLEQILQS